MSYRYPLGLFDAIGVEIEYMIVDRDTLSVRPIADELIKAYAGAYDSEIEVGNIAWSNELALHVLELKTNGPAGSLRPLPALFQENIGAINGLLEPMGAMLMPSAMHPWMDPEREMRLWPHEHSAFYENFDRIFDCKGHGWANLQSVHLNLPFADDEEFGRLHAAIRVLLPLLPALAASSPIVDGKPSGMMDTRLDVYRTNAARIPSVTGAVIPEQIFTRHEYETALLQRIYADLAPHDPEGVLCHEWVNARGCIARFDRGAVEIRVLDVQECPTADLAIAAAVIAATKALTEGRLADASMQRRWSAERLAAILGKVIVEAGETIIDDREYRQLFGYRGGGSCTASDLWRHLIEIELTSQPALDEWMPVLRIILEEGCLARRLLARLGGDVRHESLRAVYADLSRCLAGGAQFRA
jgi:gamma-glutamyl:cysteine ligase YbdK (ATP-grasp superfamily)